MLFTPDWRALTCTVRTTEAANSEKSKFSATYTKDTIRINRVDIGYVRLELTKLQKFPTGRPERAKKHGKNSENPFGYLY